VKALFTLKPDLNLLTQYGYVENIGIWSYPSDDRRPSNFIAVHHLNNIPGTPEEINANLRTVCGSYGIKALADTLIFICLDQADWFHAKLSGTYETFNHRLAVKELASLIVAMEENNKESIQLQLKHGSNVLARVTHPQLLFDIKETLTKRLFSIGFGTVPEHRQQLDTVDKLIALASIKATSPRRLKNKLRTVFIAKVHEFIAKESHIKSSIGSFTVEQRRLIYELGLHLAVFPDEHAGTDSDYIEQIYRDNVKLFKKIAKGGRVNLF
jgi:hypothetical protein